MIKANVSFWADIWVDGVSIRDNEIRVLRLPPLEVPKRRVTEVLIPGRVETLTDWDGTYQPLDKKARLFYEGSDPLAAVQILRNAKQIRFSNEPDFVFDCRVDADQVIPRMIRQWHAFDWVWRCQPLKRQAVPESQTGTTLTLINPGNEPARPLIEITGSGNVTLSIGSQTVQLAAIGAGKVTIDSELMMITQNGLPIDHKMTGPFPVIPVGSAPVSVSVAGTVTSMTVHPRWRWS